jgi:hypothetical protein
MYSNVCTNSLRTHIDIFRLFVCPRPLVSVSYPPKFHIIGLFTSFWVSLLCQENNKLMFFILQDRLEMCLSSYYLLIAALRIRLSA